MDNNPIQPMNNAPKPDNDEQRGVGVIELLFAVATLGATVVAIAVTSPKIPKAAGD